LNEFKQLGLIRERTYNSNITREQFKYLLEIIIQISSTEKTDETQLNMIDVATQHIQQYPVYVIYHQAQVEHRFFLPSSSVVQDMAPPNNQIKSNQTIKNLIRIYMHKYT
jgi:hypothetical protein